MTKVAILWHMHQPYYEDLVTHEHVLPWVRLHALKDYWGMVALLDEFPDLRLTFNLVPSLLVQIEAFASSAARDRYLDAGLIAAEALQPDDVRFILRNFFHAQRQRMIDVYPRYAELLALRGWGTSDADIEAARGRFTTADLRDLQVWQKLAWIDPAYHAGDPRIQALVRRGRDFAEADKQTLREVELELLNAVIPAYRRAMDAGTIEISTSPFYHPILPLLCDTDIFKRTHPSSSSPRHRFVHPEDAFDQLADAAAYHERLFGRRPVGLWPSEGSVSDAMVPLAARAGFRWMATDEMILGNSLGSGFARDAHGLVDQAERLYRPYLVEAGGESVACGFRDHALSDRIGFVYSGWEAHAAADDFVNRLAAAGRRAAERDPGVEPTVFVILDGENAWEHFDGGGRPFLRALYGRLIGHPELRSVTMSDACAAPVSHLAGIFPGSWIDANFYIWIGHRDDQRAWSQLGEARRVLAAASETAEPVALARARQELFIAEGSDWYWWYGDDHSSEHDAEFDELFRRHLRNVYSLLQVPVPQELFVTNISRADDAAALAEPAGLISPTIDGVETSYFEWLPAGEFQVPATAGAMHQVDRQGLLSRVLFGCGADALYVRLDSRRGAGDLLASGWRMSLTFLQPRAVRIVCEQGASGQAAIRLLRRMGDAWTEGEPRVDLQAAARSVMELRVPLSALAEGPFVDIAFFVELSDAAGLEVERYPEGRPIELTVPDERRLASGWTA